MFQPGFSFHTQARKINIGIHTNKHLHLLAYSLSTRTVFHEHTFSVILTYFSLSFSLSYLLFVSYTRTASLRHTLKLFPFLSHAHSFSLSLSLSLSRVRAYIYIYIERENVLNRTDKYFVSLLFPKEEKRENWERAE